MLESSKNVFRESRNPALEEFGGQQLKEADYSKGIPVARYKGSNRFLKIQFGSTTKIGIFGNSGSGKTAFGKAMVSRLTEKDRVIYNGGDMDNDFQHLNHYGGSPKKLQEKMGLAKNESPKEIDRKLFMPKPVYDRCKDNLSYAEAFTFGFQDINETDFKFLLGAGDLSGSQEAVLIRVLDNVDIKSTSFSELEEQIEEVASDQHNVKVALLSQLESLKNKNIISNRLRQDPLKYLNNGHAVSLGFKGWTQFMNGDMYILQFYASKLFQNMIEQAKDGDLDVDLVGLWPEFHRLVPAGESSLLKQHIENFFNMMQRRIDMPIIVDSQAPSQVPNSEVSGAYDFVGKLNHFFIGCDQEGSVLSEDEWSKVLRANSLLNRRNKDDWRSRIRELETFDFLYVNPGRHDGPYDCPVVRSLAPLCYHPAD